MVNDKIAASLAVASLALGVRTDLEPVAADDSGETAPPRKLTSRIGDPHYHPGCLRVGLIVDGVERNDIVAYDMDHMMIETIHKEKLFVTSIQPYWRFAESRQQRRARERWESSHGKS